MRKTNTRAAMALTASAALALSAVLVTPPATAKPENKLADKLVQKVKTKNLVEHLRELQQIAEASGGYDRSGGTTGYDASIAYIKAQLDEVGYETKVQTFPFVYTEELRESFRQVSPTARPLAVDVMTYSPATPVGGIEAPLVALPSPDTTPGCEAGDFATFPAGAIALIPRGGCTFLIKVQNAQKAGAAAVVVSNNDTASPDLITAGTLGTPGAATIAAAGTSLNEGNALRAAIAAGPVRVHLDVAELAEQRTTSNLVAEWPHGDPTKVVMAGAHLDSVPEGPGINDNGTGAAGVLETALQLAAKGKDDVANRVRFGWWGAEEFGLVGSTHYVTSLSKEERAKIALYLNFDMIGSPNYIFGIYDGDDSDKEGSGAGPKGSAQIEDVLERYFDTRGQNHVGTDFSGRSDYAAFIANGIPSGGLFTGAEGLKTAAHADLFGGVAGKAFDPCYHQRCDSLDPVADGADAALYGLLEQEYDLLGNVNTYALGHNADAIAYAVGTFAMSLDDLYAPAAPSGRTKHGVKDVHGDEHPADELE